MSATGGGNFEMHKLGRYTILEELAVGGMAQIFKARTGNEKILTLKKILSEYSSNPDFIKMFLEEAKISLQLKHPNVVRVLDFGQVDGAYFLAMEYVFGRDLGSMLRTSAESRVFIPIDVACHIILQCCRGLDYAHTMTDSFGKPLGIVHRDISPPNVLISYNGEAKILDFGIAKAARAGGRKNTRSGVLKGKFSYMSPEQALGQPLDQQSDLFSLAIVFWELLTCRSLFYSDDEIETLERVRKAKVEAPSKIRKDLPKELDAIVLKALAAKTRNRYKNCSEFADELKHFLKSHYPRSDARNVAKFIRSCFYEDYHKRTKLALNEGWKDILSVGGADDELLLDRTFSEQDNLPTRARDDDIGWLQRLLYDPKASDKLWRVSRWVFALGAVVGLWTYVMTSPSVRSLWEHLGPSGSEKASEATHDSTPSPSGNSASGDLELTEGSFQDWVQKGEAEEFANPELALKYYNRALSINPFEQAVLIRKNFMLLATGQIEESCQWFKAQNDLDQADKLLSDAACDEIQGELQRALSNYREFLQKFPEDRRAKAVRKLYEALLKSAR